VGSDDDVALSYLSLVDNVTDEICEKKNTKGHLAPLGFFLWAEIRRIQKSFTVGKLYSNFFQENAPPPPHHIVGEGSFSMVKKSVTRLVCRMVKLNKTNNTNKSTTFLDKSLKIP